jgi:hypothetical protein
MSDIHSRVEQACVALTDNHQPITFTAVATLRTAIEELAQQVRHHDEQIRRLNRLTKKPSNDYQLDYVPPGEYEAAYYAPTQASQSAASQPTMKSASNPRRFTEPISVS